jgi:hypothetical protein
MIASDECYQKKIKDYSDALEIKVNHGHCLVYSKGLWLGAVDFKSDIFRASNHDTEFCIDVFSLWFESIKKDKKQTIKNVYFILEEKTNLIKIGSAINCAERLKTLQTGNPNPISLLHIIKDKGLLFEKQLHRRFKKHHVRGEWFVFSEEIKAFING